MKVAVMGAGAVGAYVGGRLAQIGEDVTITSIFELRDWDQWNDLRKKAVLDPEMPKWLEIREQLAKRGRRHFYTPAEFSPQR